jgi:CheY-like chemotaxis protein
VNSNAAGSAVILCVERDPFVRDLEIYFLNQAGFGVNFAEDGLQALQFARDLHPTIVITEILVPKLDARYAMPRGGRLSIETSQTRLDASTPVSRPMWLCGRDSTS